MMQELIQLTKKETYENKEIICVGGSLYYLTELCKQYGDILPHIVKIADYNTRDLDVRQFQGRNIPVCSLQKLTQSDLSEYLLLITDDYYKEYYDMLVSLLGKNSGISEIYFFADTETTYELSYRERYAKAPLENILVFRSGPHAEAYVEGMDFSDNAKALFEYALSIGLNERYELVWIVKNPDSFVLYRRYPNVSFLPFEGSISEDASVRDRYYRVLCLAKYFFFTDAYGFVRNCRSDQIRVQLWHGCGYKKRLNSISCEKRYEYMTVTSPLYAKLHGAEFGLRKDQLLVTGCAKTDWLFETDLHVWEKLQIPAAEKYIFWLPTYRFSPKEKHKPVDGTLYEETGMPLISHMADWETVNVCLKENNMVMIIKLHPFQDREAVCIQSLSNIVLLENDDLVKHHIHLNQILGMADAMISDYSSAAVDYLILDRPMAFCIEDAMNYSETRGYIFENILDWLPGIGIKDMNGLLSFIHEIGSGYDTSGQKRSRLRQKMHRYCDQNSCKRILQSLGIV